MELTFVSHLEDLDHLVECLGIGLIGFKIDALAANQHPTDVITIESVEASV